MQLDQYYEKISELGVAIYAVSVDPPDVSKRLRQRLESQITFLSDPRGELLDALGIRHRRPENGDVAYPTAVLVDGSGAVRWTFESQSYRERAAPDAIFAAIESLDRRR